jgi:hypothetical protein
MGDEMRRQRDIGRDQQEDPWMAFAEVLRMKAMQEGMTVQEGRSAEGRLKEGQDLPESMKGAGEGISSADTASLRRCLREQADGNGTHFRIQKDQRGLYQVLAAV